MQSEIPLFSGKQSMPGQQPRSSFEELRQG
jgi:hypothetical protein